MRCEEYGDAPELQDVRVRLSVYDITSVDVKTHSFTCNFFAEISWIDPELKGLSVDDPTTAVGSGWDVNHWEPMFPYKRVREAGKPTRRWTPRLNFSNIVDLADDCEKWARVFFFEDDHVTPLPAPVVCYRISSTATFKEHYELHRFPFDAQDLQIGFVSMFNLPVTLPPHSVSTRVLRSQSKRTASTPRRQLRQSASADSSFSSTQSASADSLFSSTRARHISLVRNTSAKYRSVLPSADVFLLRSEWALDRQIASFERTSDPIQSSSGMRYPLLTFAIKAVRRPPFFVWNVVVPQFLFVMLCFPCLLLPHDALADRFSIILALLVTSVTYKSSLSDSLPKMSYLTWLDKYNVLCIMIMVALGLESAIVYQLDKHNIVKVDRIEDGIGRMVIGTWCALHVVPLVVIILLPWSGRRYGSANVVRQTSLERKGVVSRLRR